MTSPMLYRIRVRGHLRTEWSQWFDSMTLTHEASGDTMLSGPVRDQVELYGLLVKVRDLNLLLISVERVEAGSE